MDIKEPEAEMLRDELHNLDIHSLDREDYYKNLYHIITSGEGFRDTVYRDTEGILTIGYGFNMDRGHASKAEWDKIFQDSICFNDAKNGDISITKEQAKMLKRFGVSIRETELARIYAPYWDRMRANERAIVTDLYYQAPKLAGEGTKFAAFLKEYYRTNDPQHLESAVNEVKFHSSYSATPANRRGLQNRNNIRAIILDSRKCELYSKPHEPLIPEDKKIKVIVGQTVISKETSKRFPKSNHLGDYYIWRTQGDDKVRDDHKLLEGKVFRHDDKSMLHPQEDYNCRCEEEKLPINAEIIEDENTQSKDNKYYEYYNSNDTRPIIRKYIDISKELSLL